MKKTIIASLLAQLACHAWAAEDAAFSLGEIRVTASPAGSQAAPGSAVVESEELRQFDRETVGSALAIAPGVSLTKVGKRNEEMVYVRGFDLRQTPVFIDGIPVYVPYDGYADFGRFNTYDLARIEVSKGFSSLVYGPNTLGGAINLITRRPTKPFEGEAGAGTTFTREGENNGWSTWANFGGRQEQWYYQAGVSMVDEGYFRLPDGFTPAKGEDGGRRNNSDRQDSKINLKLGFTPNAVDEYAVGFVKQHGEKGTPPYAGSLQNPSYWRWPYWDMTSLYFLSTTRIGEHTLKLRAYHDIYRNSLTTYEDAAYTDALLKPGDRSWYDDYTNGASAELDLRLTAANQLRVAAHLKEDVHREHNDNEPIQRSEDLTQSYALEDTHAFSEHLSLVTGLSYDKRRGLEAQDYDAKFTKQLYNLPLASADALNGMAGVFYTLAGGDKLRATVARKSRFPTLKDRYSASFGTSIPNPDLQTEHANHFELGYTAGLGADWLFDAALFRSNITNLIQSVRLATTPCSNPNPYCSQMQNVASARASGLELSARGSLGALELQGNYTYLVRENKTDASLLTNTPHDKLFAAATWRTGAWQLTGTADAASRRYTSSDGKQVAGGYSVYGLKGGYRFAGLHDTLVEAGVHNLFDRLYEYAEGFPEPGRTFFVRFTTPL